MSRSGLLALLCLFLCVYASDDVIILSDDNFEHLTQAATGATTGDWLVLFVKSDNSCVSCAEIIPFFQSAAQTLKGETNFGMVDINTSPDTCERFGIVTGPIVLFFHHGQFYRWPPEEIVAGVEKEFVSFVQSSFKNVEAVAVPPELGFFHKLKQHLYVDFSAVMKASQKKRQETMMRVVFLVAPLVVVIGAILVYGFSAPTTPAKRQLGSPHMGANRKFSKKRTD